MSKLDVVIAGEKLFPTALGTVKRAARKPGHMFGENGHNAAVVCHGDEWMIFANGRTYHQVGPIGAAYALADKWAEEAA